MEQLGTRLFRRPRRILMPFSLDRRLSTLVATTAPYSDWIWVERIGILNRKIRLTTLSPLLEHLMESMFGRLEQMEPFSIAPTEVKAGISTTTSLMTIYFPQFVLDNVVA